MTKKNKTQKDDEIVYDNENNTKNSFSKSHSSSKLKNKIKELEKEKKEYLNGWQRTQADLINLKKRHQEEKKVFTEIGKISLLEEIIPVLDNFDAAFSNKEAWEKTPKEWRVGIEYIYNQFLTILEKNNVQSFGQEGELFNEEFYNSIENIETDNEEKKNTIAIVVQKGYKIGERIIRPAKVKVYI